MLKLETICLQNVMNLEMVTTCEIIPSPLIEKIQEIEAINGHFISVDQNDMIKQISIKYNGESTHFTFKLIESIHTVTICKNECIPNIPELQYFVKLGPHTEMYMNISLNGNVAKVLISAEDFQWKSAANMNSG